MFTFSAYKNHVHPLCRNFIFDFHSRSVRKIILFNTSGVISDDNNTTVKPVLSSHSKIDKTKVLKTNYHLMQVESIAECSPGAAATKAAATGKFSSIFLENQRKYGLTFYVNYMAADDVHIHLHL